MKSQKSKSVVARAKTPARLVLATLALTGLLGCGQKRPLQLPAAAGTAAPASAAPASATLR